MQVICCQALKRSVWKFYFRSDQYFITNTNAVESVCSFTKLDENNSEQVVWLEFKMRTDVIFDCIKNCQARKFHQLVTHKKLLKFPSSALTNMDEQDLSIQNLNWVLTHFKILFYMCLCNINTLKYFKTIASSVLSAGSIAECPNYKLTAGV
jgi:hypothetical protein